MMRRATGESGGRQWLRYTACYLLLALLLALGYVAFAIIWRGTIIAVIAAFTDETDVDQRFTGSAIYLFGIVVLMVGFFVAVMAGEPYLRRGAERGMLVRRFARLALPLVAFGALGVLLEFLARLAG